MLLAKPFCDVSKFLVFYFCETVLIKLNTYPLPKFFTTLVCLLTLIGERGKDICLGFGGGVWLIWVT